MSESYNFAIAFSSRKKARLKMSCKIFIFFSQAQLAVIRGERPGFLVNPGFVADYEGDDVRRRGGTMESFRASRIALPPALPTPTVTPAVSLEWDHSSGELGFKLLVFFTDLC